MKVTIVDEQNMVVDGVQPDGVQLSKKLKQVEKRQAFLQSKQKVPYKIAVEDVYKIPDRARTKYQTNLQISYKTISYKTFEAPSKESTRRWIG
jgi:hypothetical protein